MRRVFEKSAYVAALILVFIAVISCEKDFTEIGSSIINNTKFSTNSLFVDVKVENAPITEVVSDNISLEPGNYLLGVHVSDTYENIEASIVSQLVIASDLELIDSDTIIKYETTTTHIITTIDTVFLRLPYQVTLNDDGDAYELDSIIGDQSKAFTLNIYQTSTYLSRLNPVAPAKNNSYNSNSYNSNPVKTMIEKTVGLNSQTDFPFMPRATDTAIVIKRRINNGTLYDKDTVTYMASTTSTVPLPFAIVPLKEDKIKELFLDQYESSEFDSQDAFNNYFRGIILEASGSEGSLISFNFNATIKPSIEVYYTNTVLQRATNDTIKTFRKNDSFPLEGIRVASYNMEEKTYSSDKIILQGAAGSEATIELFSDGTNVISKEISNLRARNLLVNDASLTFYINKEADTTATPYQLFLYKSDEDPTNPSYSQIKDIYTEGTFTFGGLLERDSEGKQEKYTFRITDYISDILSGETDYSPTLRLKVINPTDLRTVTDTVYTNYNWNPKAVTLLNGDKKAELKISYSEKKN